MENYCRNLYKETEEDVFVVYFNSTQKVSIFKYLRRSSLTPALLTNHFLTEHKTPKWFIITPAYPKTILCTLQPPKPQLEVNLAILSPPRPELTNAILPSGPLRKILVSVYLNTCYICFSTQRLHKANYHHIRYKLFHFFSTQRKLDFEISRLVLCPSVRTPPVTGQLTYMWQVTNAIIILNII